MAMSAAYHALPDAKGLSLSVETNLTKCEGRRSLVGQENFQNNKDKFINLQTILEQIDTIINIEEGYFSDIKTEIENKILSTDMNVLQEYLHSAYKTHSEPCIFMPKMGAICVYYLIAYHVLVANQNQTQMLNFVKGCLPTVKSSFQFACEYIFNFYFDVYCKDNQNDVFTNIHAIWKLDPITEFKLKFEYCSKLIKAKDYKTLINLIHHHDDYFIERFESQDCTDWKTATMVLLHILHHKVSINQMEKVETETILSRIKRPYNTVSDNHILLDEFYDSILTLDNKQILSTPYFIKLIQHVMKEQPLDFLKIILVCCNRLRQANHYTECIKFIKYHFQFISSFPIDGLKIIDTCYYRQQYCITLLLLLNECVSGHDTHKMNLILIRLLDLRVSFLSNNSCYSCYCFMGYQDCTTTRANTMQDWSFRATRYRVASDFKTDLLHNYQRNESRQCGDFNLLMKHVIYGKLELAPYIQSILDMDISRYEDESILFFKNFFERSAKHNAATLYAIIKTLCNFDLQPRFQDLIIQGLTAYFMISCNRQYGLLSKFILDISMICPKGQFSQKLTLDMAKSLLKFDDDTVNDFRKTIYHCYCTVRHGSRNKKDTNITKYKDHFKFIASMEAEEEMMKFANLKNFLLMLIILFITSGGHHKSAELKKYLSLKYEYEDAILYLLWCSGDVEVNPGPTLRKLRKVSQSEKERNWIYEMSSILLRLLKFESIAVKNDGLWKENSSFWPHEWPLLYDPRNKPQDKKYGIETDRIQLKNLELLCNEKGIFEDIKRFDDHTKSKVKEYKTEITAWKNNKAKLFEVYTLRQELNRLKEAKGNLHKYRNDPEVLQFLEKLNANLTFDPKEDKYVSSESYTDIVRDLAITFCRIGKGLNPLQKSDKLWQIPPSRWCHPKEEYFSPCNAGQREDKGTDKELVDKLLKCCETKIKEYFKTEKKPVLMKLLNAWKHENEQEVWKYHTIWSNIEVIDHSLKYLKLEGLLAKSQTHLEKLGIKPREFKESIQVSTDLPSCPVQNKQTYPKCPTIIQSHQENHFDTTSKLRDSDASQKVVPLSLMGSEYQETDQTTQNKTNKRKHQTTDENYTEPKKLHKSDKGKPLLLQVLTSSSEYGKNKANTSPKGHSHDCKIISIKSRPNFPALEKQTDPLVINKLPDTSDGESGNSSSHLGRDGEKDNADKNIQTTLYLDDKLKDLLYELDQDYSPAMVDAQSGNSSSHIGRDGEKDNAEKNIQTTSDPDYSEKEMIAPLVELNPDDVTAILEELIQESSSTTDQSSDVCNELPEYVQLYIDTVENSYNPDDTLNIDIEQFIEEQDMDLS